jgi:hypothetical protein
MNGSLCPRSGPLPAVAPWRWRSMFVALIASTPMKFEVGFAVDMSYQSECQENCRTTNTCSRLLLNSLAENRLEESKTRVRIGIAAMTAGNVCGCSAA